MVEMEFRAQDPVAVHLRDALGQPCAARLDALAADGLRLRCADTTARRLLAQGTGLESLVHAEFDLPLARGPARVSVGLRLCERRVAPDGADWEVGCQFLALRPRARRLLEAFLRECR